MKLLITILLLTGCSYFEKDKTPKVTNSHEMIGELERVHALYLSLEHEGQDKYGFNTGTCDKLLMTALQVASGGKADLTQARDPDGRWWRTVERNCLSGGGAASSISRDMILGVVLAAMVTKNHDMIDKLIEYAEEHSYIMGDHNGSVDGESRTILTPALIASMMDVRWALEGRDMRAKTPQVWGHIPGYQTHLQAIHILIRGLVDGGVSTYMLKAMEKNIESDPTNALYRSIYHKFTDGDQSKACDLLFEHFPKDRLPTTNDQCHEYRYMHGNPEDWKPCKGNATHTGTDFNLVAAIILGKI